MINMFKSDDSNLVCWSIQRLLCAAIFASILSLPRVVVADSSPKPVFVLRSAPAVLAMSDRLGTPIYGGTLSARGLARIDRRGVLLIDRGRFIVEQAGPVWAATLAENQGFTIEIAGRCSSIEGAGTILSFESEDTVPTLRIVQVKGEGLFFLAQERNGTTLQLPMSAESSSVDFHCVLMYDGHGTLHLSDRISSRSPSVTLSLPRTTAPQLILGGTLSGADGWNGVLERVVLYPDVLPAEAVSATFRDAKESKDEDPHLDRLLIDAELIAKSTIPTLDELSPYTHALSIFEYRVKRVLTGTLVGDRVYVAHWIVMDSIRLPFADTALGSQHVLTLEQFADQLQLQSTHISDSVVDDFDRPLFFDAGGASLGAGTPSQAGVP